MPRVMTPAVLAALTSSYVSVAILVDATFRTGTTYLWTGKGTLNANGNTYQGVGALGSVSVVEDGATVEARGISLNLSGIYNYLLADVLQELQLGAPVNVWMALFDSSGALIPNPILVWAGRMDQPTIEAGGQTAQLKINCENRLLDMNVSVNRRYTQDDQTMDWPGDVGLQFALGIVDRTIYWGAGANGNNV